MKAGRWRWSWQHKGALATRNTEIDLSAINRPHIWFERIDEHWWGFAVSWGNGSSDPVWSVSFEIGRGRP